LATFGVAYISLNRYESRHLRPIRLLLRMVRIFKSGSTQIPVADIAAILMNESERQLNDIR
jgi:hypothetical protein